MTGSDSSGGDENVTYVSDLKNADDNVIQSFQLESSSLRGRSVRLGSVLDKILGAHNYPDTVSVLLAETVSTSLLLASMLKYEGIFTLQIQGDGIVSMLVCDVTSDGDIRAYALFDEDKLGDKSGFADLVGSGYMAFTVDQGENTERYQGIVELKGSSLVDCVQHYFNQSEQIGTGIKLASQKTDDGHWRAGAMMLQHMPEDEQNYGAGKGNTIEDNWRRAMILMGSCTDEEMLDPYLHSNVLLRRLFHEEGVRVFEPHFVRWKCRCTEQKVLNVLRVMSEEELREVERKNGIKIVCEFCSTEYRYTADEVMAHKNK